MFTPGFVDHYIVEHRREMEQMVDAWHLAHVAREHPAIQSRPIAERLRKVIERVAINFHRSRSKSNSTIVNIAADVFNQAARGSAVEGNQEM